MGKGYLRGETTYKENSLGRKFRKNLAMFVLTATAVGGIYEVGRRVAAHYMAEFFVESLTSVVQKPVEIARGIEEIFE